ncbi:hypothetical protein G6F46_015583 [Rhizopus delemar]|nr:hypothetical protein G6F46_015583 [Rhizopus delemar]
MPVSRSSPAVMLNRWLPSRSACGTAENATVKRSSRPSASVTATSRSPLPALGYRSSMANGPGATVVWYSTAPFWRMVTRALLCATPRTTGE